MEAYFQFLILLIRGFIMFSSVFVLGCNPQQQGQTSVNQEADPLPSWTDAEAKQRIIQFVLSSVDSSHESFVPLSERIAVFDNDGTLWGEQPFYFQLAFAFDRVKTMAAQHPEWKGKEPFKSVLKGDLNAVMAGGEKSLVQIIAATHSNIPHQVFEESVKGWTDTAKHPVSGRRYIDMVYQPMLELLKYLRSNGYTTWIVSGGGIDFIRAWSEKVYGIPPAQVIGSSIKAAYAFKSGKPEITKLPQLAFVDDGPGKPVGIYQHIGKVPVIAVGNSDGDYEMLQYTTTSGEYKRLGLFIHHTDNEREVAYDSLSHIGKLKRGLTDASSNGWLLVDMKKDWKSVYPE